MEAIYSLKKRLIGGRSLCIQSEGGGLSEASFEWNKAASDEEIKSFELLNKICLPEDFKKFLKISNGAMLFEDMKYGQWGCRILGLNEIMKRTSDSKDWGYDIKEDWLIFATWLGDGDVLVFDMEKYKLGEKYIIDGDQGYQTNEWEYIRGGFGDWISRLIVAQGAKYWRWY